MAITLFIFLCDFGANEQHIARWVMAANFAISLTQKASSPIQLVI
jgi:hypothetical protein